MAKQRSFKDYVADQFYNELFSAIAEYIETYFDARQFSSRIVKNADTAALSNILLKYISVEDLPGTCISFEVILEAEIDISETQRHYDNSDLITKWFSVQCCGDLNQRLHDFTIQTVRVFNTRSIPDKPLDDALVPVLQSSDLEAAAMDFLRRNYPKALSTPMAVDVAELAAGMGLTIEHHHITKDFSVFGQIFFADCNAEIYDTNSDEMIEVSIPAKTIIVDPKAFYLRNLGSVNNTIVHECVHWDRHRKAFELERLYNTSATQIKCQVVGGIKDEKTRSATDWMEWQANALAPRIQMPLGPFKTKAHELVRTYQKMLGTYEFVDVMEPVIDELATFFCVSRHAAKIRMVDIGFEEAVGAFTYIDGRYVKPHAFKKGSIGKNQTYSISAADAVVETLWNAQLREKTQNGAYIYVDAHVCLNDPKYVSRDNSGNVVMTEYGRLHVDECCLAFTLQVKSVNKYGEQFYRECVLFRDVNSGLHFEAHFAAEKNQNVETKAAALAELNTEVMSLKAKLPASFCEALKMTMKWAEVTVEGLAESALLSARTIQRMRNEPAYIPELKTIIAICIGMHLHPIISRHLIDTAGYAFRYILEEHMMYDFFISSYYTHSVAECNELLNARGFADLSGLE